MTFKDPLASRCPWVIGVCVCLSVFICKEGDLLVSVFPSDLLIRCPRQDLSNCVLIVNSSDFHLGSR